ncbi:MAG: hypothetical protein BroJett013_25930 [Alphaproteobacteria bacterium]|nr:MAG: hypothetical protein BroJett013_25930 [Alphaproteobacteria bacterium]
MTRGRWREHPQAEAKQEQLFAFVGRYLIGFQWMEGKLDEIILLGRGHENWADTQRVLAARTNEAKVEMVRELIFGQTVFRKVTIDGWYEHVDLLIARLHSERQRRNDLLHASFLFDLIALGGPVIAISRRRGADHTERFSEDGLTDDRQGEILAAIGDLADNVARLHTQLIHVYEP